MGRTMTLKRTAFLIIIAALSLSLLFSPVAAQDSDQTEDTTTSDEAGNDANVNRRQQLRDTITDRISDYKQNRQAAIDAAREDIITRKCAAAQTRVETFLQRVENAKSRREAVYTNILDKLSNIITRLNETDVDTTELTTLVTTANETYRQISADYDAFLVVLGDIVDMDCAEDPEGFQAALEAARSQGADLRSDVTDFHIFLKEDVKSAFRAAIGASDDSNDSSEGDS